MTEPPEPRHPEEGDGEDDAYDEGLINDPDEFFSTDWSQVDEDDTLLDFLGSGMDVARPGSPREQELADKLSAERDAVNTEPVPPFNELADAAERAQNRATAPPRSTEGAPAPMISESIAALQSVAGNTAAAGPLQEAKNSLDSTVLAQLMQAVGQLAELNAAATKATEGNANGQAEIQATGEHAAGAIEDAIELVQAAIAGVDQAIQHEATFRTAASNVANRLAGS